MLIKVVLKKFYVAIVSKGARDISSYMLRGVRGLRLHIPKKLAYGRPRDLTDVPERYTCSTCPRSTHNVSIMKSEIKSMNNIIKS